MSSEKSLPIRRAPWSLTLLTVGGIPLRVHASFALLLLWVAAEGGTAHNAISEILFVISIFACVLLHELGHALVAKRFGLKTKDITLYPFGGIASLMGTPTAWAELWIALAGPAVNLVIAALIFPAIGWQGLATAAESDGFVVRLLAANLFLAIFNMLPAFPMDGGRVLRALLTLLKVRQATAISSRLSQGLSIALGLFALYVENPVLVVIAVFVFMNAMQELIQSRTLLGAAGRTVGEVMIERGKIQELRHGMTLSEALDVALRSTQPAFPVLFGEQIVGVVTRETILHEAALAEGEQYLSGIVDREYQRTAPGEMVDALVSKLEGQSGVPILVVDDGRLVGMVYREKLLEFLYLHGIRRARAEQQADSDIDQNGP